ncbi:Imm1 family immunity protein [Polymorphospora sp. NPDC050346]|uniref:Imm1 family immunity protein n=1 Tax=Polymorphospora sp. NPDC050346 TaxID=3155780 RepID=UPI0033F0B80A
MTGRLRGDDGPTFTFDYAGTPTDAWPERTRVTPAGARAAAHEFLTSGGRPALEPRLERRRRLT